MTGNSGLTCPVCGEAMPAPKGRGRPREFCGKTCTARARQRRERAARLLEFALRVDEQAGEARASRLALAGGEWPERMERRARSHEERAIRLREMAAAELRGLPL